MLKRAAFAALLLVVVPIAAFAQQTRRYIVGMKAGVTRAAKAGQFAGRSLQDLPNLDSFIVDLSDAEVQQMRNDPSVRYVESADIKFFASDKSVRPGRTVVESHPVDAQITPYGITMVHAPQVWPVTKGDGVNVAIVDTGIDYTHPELKDHYQGGFNAITGTNDPRDDDGHGSHVAGTIGAADNGIGVVGVAPNVRIWSAKVLQPDSSGGASGTNAQIASGLNWVLSKKNEVGGHWIVNMSLGQCTDTTVDPTNCNPTPSSTMQNACQKLADAGVLVFAASGNDSTLT
ncbi:MAG: S8 family serine peptidase, partial [Thermoanaerobaculia bacterium]